VPAGARVFLPVKILFVMRHPAAVRSLGSVLRTLDARGHHVHLAFGGIKPEAHKVLQRLADECQGLTFGGLPGRRSPGWDRGTIGWSALARRLRVDSDYLRYLEPGYADAPALRARAAGNAHPLMRRASGTARLGGAPTVRALRRTVEAVEHCLEPPPHVERFLTDFEPDVVLVTHLARDSVQADYVRAAKRLGLHSAYPVFSWDNLTNKGLVHEVPELVLVWNTIQADEAVELQGIPREQVRVAGAWSYDHWFEWAPSRSREDFCSAVGLRADRPIVLYVCSSGFVARDEVSFVRRWQAALRAHGGPLTEAGVIVRPHPRNASQWARVSLDDRQATVWPQLGEEPLEVGSRQNYFDSIHHAAAVVGINTSAQIESAIVGRPVHTVLADEFRDTQQGTLHFQYLKADEFGHLHVGRTMEEHLDQLEESLRGRADDGRNDRFLRTFVRPFGLDVAATPLYVEAIEELAARPAPKPDRGPAAGPLVRRALAPLAGLAGRRAAARRKPSDGRDEELRAAVRRLKRDQSQVVAGPWLGSETAELLYWIPFLRWVQTATFGLRDRLVVACRPGSASWYEGLGARRVSVEEVGSVLGAMVLQPELIDERRAELAAGKPNERFQRRHLEFARLAAPEPPAGLEHPEELVATWLGPELHTALATHGAVVSLDGLDRPAQAAVLARARGFVGTYGAEAILAVLSGVPAVVLSTGAEPADELQVVSSFLARPPFGQLRMIEAAESPAETAGRAAQLLEAPLEALAGV
jgi:hypothetical protein